ncbi:hypothetical protein EXIGLDRAFT_732099 [Exidia glandulosa HHB12029]|uniref:Uncharacterized protein n=1 Tax=Exidia glandulosa HHB12029 TaxID=1314781 RepID=A0A165BMX8_EXIGL|nr:hypothetical protein EXIGLDRAFT_732099 [Exidia glandulosa HHB12029]
MDCPQDTIELQATAPVNTARPRSDTDAYRSKAGDVTHGDADSEEPLEHFNFHADGTASSKYQGSSGRTSDNSPVDNRDRNPAPDDSPGTGQVSLPGVADSEEYAKPSDPIDTGSPSPSNCQEPSDNDIRVEPVDNDERNDPPDWMPPHAQVQSPAAWATPAERASTK